MDVGNWESNERDRQWVALYTTKDHRAGKPVTTSSFTVGSKPSSTSEFVSIRKFNEDSAYNLAVYSKATGSSDSVYVSYKPDSKYVWTSAASVFSEATPAAAPIAFGAGGLVIGLLAGVGIGFAAKKKKKEADA